MKHTRAQVGAQQAHNRRTPIYKNEKKEKKDTNTGNDADVIPERVTGKGYDPLGAEIIKEFEGVNPAAKRMYGNTTQRKACDELISTHGLEKTIKVVRLLSRTNGTPFMPTITSPDQLVVKWAALEAAFIKKKNERVSGVQSRITPDI